MRQRRTYDGYVLMTRTEQSLLELHPAVNESRQAAIDVGYDSPSDATFRGACNEAVVTRDWPHPPAELERSRYEISAG